MPVIAQALRELCRLAIGQVDDEQLLRAIVEIALAIELEQEAIDLDRWRSLRLVAHAPPDLRDHDGTFAVRREIELADAARDLRDLARAAAFGRDAPQLGFLVLAGVAQVEDRFAVAREMRLRLAGIGSFRELACGSAVPGNRPEI